MSMTSSTIRRGAVFSTTLLLGSAALSSMLLSSTAALAQRPTTIDSAGIQALVARSTFQAVHVEPAAVQRPGSKSDDAAPEEDINPAVAHAIGCLIAGSVGTGIAAMAGTNNVVNIIAGGQVVPASQLALYTAVAGVIFGTFCAVGQALTPLYMHVARATPQPARPPLPPRPVDQKVRFESRHFEMRAQTGSDEHATVGHSNQDVDMSVPASWLRTKP
jgi:hypothetical protein